MLCLKKPACVHFVWLTINFLLIRRKETLNGEDFREFYNFQKEAKRRMVYLKQIFYLRTLQDDQFSSTDINSQIGT